LPTLPGLTALRSSAAAT